MKTRVCADFSLSLMGTGRPVPPRLAQVLTKLWQKAKPITQAFPPTYSSETYPGIAKGFPAIKINVVFPQSWKVPDFTGQTLFLELAEEEAQFSSGSPSLRPGCLWWKEIPFSSFVTSESCPKGCLDLKALLSPVFSMEPAVHSPLLWTLPALNPSGINCWRHWLGTRIFFMLSAIHPGQMLNSAITETAHLFYFSMCPMLCFTCLFIRKQPRGLHSICDLHCMTSGQLVAVSCKIPSGLPPPSLPRSCL